LWAERRVDQLSKERFDYLEAQFAKPEAEQFIGVPVPRASDIIKRLKALPVRDNIVRSQNSTLPDVPAGRYAIENADGELRFYHLWVSNNGYVKLYLLHGPDSSDVPRPAMISILEKIKATGPAECAARFGIEIGACSNCGRRLTNRLSRELGIGPVCGGRWYGDDDWKAIKQKKRDEIVARGDDPDEEVEDASPGEA
jgi:phosphoglycolate phosphatase-like HAD superfamily hydrolase